jgi:acyl-ACP thioesterase
VPFGAWRFKSSHPHRNLPDRLAGVLDPAIPVPLQGRTFSARRRVRLADIDPRGRVRLDALARLLQDVAIDDVQETGWGTPSHLWFVRRIRIDIHKPFLQDSEVHLVTWCSGLAAIAAGRRWSLTGDEGGQAEVDSVWIHLGPDQRPARIEGFGVYGEATGGRSVSTKLELPDPPPDARSVPWPLRFTDIDPHGHLNNAIYWQAVEHVLASSPLDLALPLVAELDYRAPIDARDEIDLVTAVDGRAVIVALRASDGVRAVARVEGR